MASGTEETRRFYDNIGWKIQGDKLVDVNLFGIREDGPIRMVLHKLLMDRVRSALGANVNLLECGCGGNPAKWLLDKCSRYTGVDFSDTGLDVARTLFSDVTTPHEFRNADVCNLPFEDGAFDAVYSAQMIFHIADPSSQDAALSQMARVVRRGGTIVLIAANPYPLLFLGQLVRGIARDLPLVGAALNSVRKKPPLPYKPMPIGWMRTRLGKFGRVEVLTGALPTTYFNQNVTEHRGIGKLLWKGIRWLDINHPTISAYLGSYVMMVGKKT